MTPKSRSRGGLLAENIQPLYAEGPAYEPSAFGDNSVVVNMERFKLDIATANCLPYR